MRSEAQPSHPQHEALLWQAGRLLPDEEAPDFPTSELEAYRRGELGADQANRIESALLKDGRLRERLAASAGTDREGAPPAEIRERVLAAFAEAAPSEADAANTVVADATAEHSESRHRTPASATASTATESEAEAEPTGGGKVLAFPGWKSAPRTVGIGRAHSELQ